MAATLALCVHACFMGVRELLGRVFAIEEVGGYCSYFDIVDSPGCKGLRVLLIVSKTAGAPAAVTRPCAHGCVCVLSCMAICVTPFLRE